MSRETAARAVAALADGEPELAAVVISELNHQAAIGSLLEVSAVMARFTSAETGIPTGRLLAAVGEHP